MFVRGSNLAWRTNILKSLGESGIHNVAAATSRSGRLITSVCTPQNVMIRGLAIAKFDVQYATALTFPQLKKGLHTPNVSYA